MIGLQSTSAYTAATQLSRYRQNVSLSVARLSSGERITRAADDVAGLSVSTRMLARETALRSTLTNLAQASSLLQVADGGLHQVEDILQRMGALSVMADSGGVTDSERAFLDIEFQHLKTEIDRVSAETNFNGVSLLDGPGVASRDNVSAGTHGLQTGTEEGDHLVGGEDGDALYGLAGDDVLEGKGGDDVLNAGTGDDIVRGGGGDDRITVAAASQVGEEVTLPVTAGLVVHMDAGTTSSITAHPGTVTLANDLSVANNDVVNDVGAVLSGSDTIGGRNALTFGGGSALQIANTNDINLLASNQRTVMVSFEAGADVNARQVLYEEGGTVNGFNIYIDGGKLYVGAWKNSGADFNIHLGADIEANTAYAAGFVFDFSGSGDFRGYLNGTQFGSGSVGFAQSAHSGLIGVGGKNNDTFYYDGASAGDGDAFVGKMGELLNYSSGLSASQAADVQDYLMTRWGIGQTGTGDTVSGGAGSDTLAVTSGKVQVNLNENADIREVELLDLTGNDEQHSITVKDGYYTLGDGLEGGLTIDASGNTEAITVNAALLTGDNMLTVLGGDGGDTITGAGTGNTQVSYANARSVIEADLVTGIVYGRDGTDDLTNIANLAGSAYNDTLGGSFGSDTVLGGDGDDVITDISLKDGRLVMEGLVHYISAEDIATITVHPGTVTLVTDQSGSGNNALNDTGAVLSGADTINDKNSLTFDGASFLRIPTTNDINNTGQAQRSIFVTFETGDDITSRQVIYEEGGGTNGYNIYIEGGRMYVAVWQNGGATYDLALSIDVAKNSAYTGGFVFDSSGSGTFRGYLNDVMFGEAPVAIAQGAHSGDIGIGGMNNASFFQGSAAAGDGYAFQGEIGELLIYNNALNATQLDDLQNYLILQRIKNFGGNDVLSGGAGNDTITGGGGYDTIDGGDGLDTAVYGGKVSDYAIVKLDENTYRVSDKRATNYDGSDTLIGIESLRFSDGTITLKQFDIDQEDLTFQVTEKASQYLEIILPNVTTETLFIDQGVNIRTQDAAALAYDEVRGALAVVTAERARIGARQSQVGIISSVNDAALREGQAARAVMSDTDIARTSTDFALELLHTNVSAAILAQANSLQESIINDVFYPAVGTVAENSAA